MIFNKLNVCSLILLLYLVHGFVSTGRHFTREFLVYSDRLLASSSHSPTVVLNGIAGARTL